MEGGKGPLVSVQQLNFHVPRTSGHICTVFWRLAGKIYSLVTHYRDRELLKGEEKAKIQYIPNKSCVVPASRNDVGNAYVKRRQKQLVM